MSCENTNARLQIKYTTIAGQEPTIPSTNDHNDGTWNPTDIYIGEFFLNATDDKLWVRTIDGLLPMGGTGGTGSFIGDFVSKANGGTYSGPVFAPTFSAFGITSLTISATAIDATIFGSSGSVYYGDGSNLTGVTTNWDGGSVGLPTDFNNTVEFNDDISIGNVYPGTLGYIDIHSNVTVNGGVSASYFVGDGSLLTNLPMGPTANYYTTNSYLDGTTLRFDRTDLADAYSVDLTPILFTQSVAGFDWNSSSNAATIFINDGSFFTINLNTFTDISTGIINATDVYATNFYGNFVGTFSEDIFTTGGTLVGTDLVFDRSNGSSYSVDLSTLPSGGSASNLQQVLVNGNYTGNNYILAENGFGLSNYNGVSTSKGVGFDNDSVFMYGGTGSFDTIGALGVVAISNFGTINTQTQADVEYNMNYGGAGSGTFKIFGYSGFAGIEYATDFSASYSNRSLVDKAYVDAQIGGGATGLGGVLSIDNQTNGNDINLNLGDVIISDDLKKTIGFEEPRIFVQNEYSTTEYTFTGILEVKNDVATSQLAHIRTDLTSGDTITTAVQIDETTASILSNNQTTSNDALVRADSGSGTSPQAEVRLATNDFYGNTSYMIMNPGNIEVSGYSSDGFGGIEYGDDYSTYYTNRSLVDKEYVDGLVAGGGATPSLTQVLAVGATSGTWIDFERTKGIREAGATGSTFRFLSTRSFWSTQDGGLNSSAISLYKSGQVVIESSNGIDGVSLTLHDSGTIYSGGVSQDGIQYAVDYSAGYTNRSLVDKEYVDNAVAGGGGATPSLAQVLTTGNIASTDIDMNQNQIQNVSVIDADGNVGIQTINMINASLLTLMYNT